MQEVCVGGFIFLIAFIVFGKIIYEWGYQAGMMDGFNDYKYLYITMREEDEN